MNTWNKKQYFSLASVKFIILVLDTMQQQHISRRAEQNVSCLLQPKEKTNLVGWNREDMEIRSAFELKRDSIREKNRSLAQPPCNQQFHFEDVKQKKQLKDFQYIYK
jgi:hypothetical protein